ncbi:GspH/FimT family pseudopilin [Pseudoroseomonas sp. WGS1072]|uniref:GspH/FimT family pseudopilin n=1 Tax=Roseomonas sp. WGS1072 TaxID=3366816 RepID=UPI003BEF8432
MPRLAPAAPGFTLVETMVVLLILGLAASAVPRLWGAGQGALLRDTARQAAALLREARAEARRSGRETLVVFDTARGSLQRPGAAALGVTPGLALAVEAPLAEAGEAGRLAIRFDAEGGSTGGRVRLSRGGMTAAVEVDWMTGHVRLFE